MIIAWNTSVASQGKINNIHLPTSGMHTAQHNQIRQLWILIWWFWIGCSPLQFLTSGGGSKAWKGNFHYSSGDDEMKFYYDGQGFMSVELTSTDAQIVFHDVFAQVLHTLQLSKSNQLYSANVM